MRISLPSLYVAFGKSEGQLEPPRNVARNVFARASEPFTQIHPDGIDTIVPYPFDRRREIFVELMSDFGDNLVEHVAGMLQIRPLMGNRLTALNRSKSSNWIS